jgi:hydroxymethylpyrimidine/phosphomethylpyrimidine kinase
VLAKALTIAGSDSGGGAGIQADLKTFSALNVYGMSAVTAITAQNTRGVSGVQAIEAELVAEQIRAVASDIGIHAAKTGMLFSVEIIQTVAKTVQDTGPYALVVDPVMVATSGDRLLQPEAEVSLQRDLIPLATVVTPNLDEVAVLVGYQVSSLEAMQDAARQLVAGGAPAVVVKGGHAVEKATDVFYDGRDMTLLRGEIVPTPNTHGTGCTFSAAICALLARGAPLPEAVRGAKTYISGALRHALTIGQGSGPVGHFWNITYPPDLSD